ncbi:MAG: hypothetical protein K8U57_07290 [Planctomycetes bacterium]|nr:hypothetical protein [Planctomycetota bacterium]
MILFTRVEARDFRALFARCHAGRPRGPAPPVLIRFQGGTRTIACSTSDGMTLTHISTTDEPDELLLLPGSVLAEVEGSTDEGVNLDRQSRMRGAVHWHTGDKPRKLPIELLLPGKQHEFPAPPEFSSVSPELLTALHECGRSTARENGRFALSRIQLQGRAGRVVGTDGKIALLAAGFTFPFTDDILVPALPVFGSKPLLRAKEVRVGRSSTHLVIAAGPWTVWMPFEIKARYPDVLALIPRRPTTVAQLDHNDVVELLKVLSGLPGKDDDDSPVTIDVGSTVKIRGRDEKTQATQEVPLTHSTVSGPPQQLAFNRRILARALSLGCRTLNVTPEKPVVAEGEHFRVIALALDPSLIVPPTVEARKSTIVALSPTPTTLEQPIPTIQRSNVMPPPDTNGHTPPRGDPADPLLAAEELRDALAVTHAKAVRLVAILKAGRKEKRVLASVVASLKQLGLDSGGLQ